jgi:hypothetical protein
LGFFISQKFYIFEKILIMELAEVSTHELFQELNRRGLFTNAKSNKEILAGQISEETHKLIISKGIPPKLMECRECRQELESHHFSYYQGRVSEDGHLMRSNALCYECSTKSNKERQKAFDNSGDIPKPKKGSVCPSCERKWSGNWHRHHVGEEVLGWLCGPCNMSMYDQRNKDVKG